jgi:hypothetical protein
MRRSPSKHLTPIGLRRFPILHLTKASLWPQPNSNIEIRNSKQIQSTNAPMFKTETQRGPWFWSFEFGSLGIVSDFVLRISDFQLLRKSQKRLDLRFKPSDESTPASRQPKCLGPASKIGISSSRFCQETDRACPTLFRPGALCCARA